MQLLQLLHIIFVFSSCLIWLQMRHLRRALVMASHLNRQAFKAFSFWNTSKDMYLGWHIRIKPWRVIKLNIWKYFFSCHLHDGYYIKFDSALPTLIPLWLQSIFPLTPVTVLFLHLMETEKKKSPTSLCLSTHVHFVFQTLFHISLSPFYRVSGLFAYLSSVHCVFQCF